MANRNWRSGGYQTFNQILTPMSYYPQPISYQTDRKNYGGRGGYRDDNSKRERKDFQSNRRERFSPNPNKRRSPYPRPQETNGNFRKDPKKSRGGYEVKVPHSTFDIKELSESSLKFRYPKLCVPSDFFHSRLNVQEAFPLYRPMKLGNHCEFQIINKDVEEPHKLVTEPDDINYKYSAKVMLMTTPNLSDLYKLSCHMPMDEAPTHQIRYGVYKQFQFLVGNKGKNEPVAIGGPWSPSLDGDNPEEDPNVLIKTAIRTCKELTGIDLSHCKKWYKFLDIQYYRTSNKKVPSLNEDEKNEETVSEEVLKEEPVIETVTIFIPDVWSCVPSVEKWAEVKDKYEKKLQSLLFPKIDEVSTVEDIKMEEASEELKVEKLEEVCEKNEETKEQVMESDPATVAALDLNQMKVTELRTELLARGLDGKGLKSQLIQRLQEAIDKEKQTVGIKEESNKAENHVTQEENTTIQEIHKVIEPPVEIAVCQLPEKEQKRLKWLYRINEDPSILVHPSKNANGEINTFNVMTLDRLLECHRDDQKEQSFEVSLFVEQFSEMIQRDAAFVIYKALVDLPDTTSKELTTATIEPEAKKARLETDPRMSKIIVDMDLLFAFFVFDNENCGYLRDNDLENILHCIGLNLSRSQAKKLLSRMPNKKGSIIYRDMVERDVVEGSFEDVTSLRTGEPNMDRLIELSRGNKSFFDEVDTHSVSRQGNLESLDKLTRAEVRMMKHQVQLTLLCDELKKIKDIQESAGDVAIHLRENIKKIEDKLSHENETLSKLTEIAVVYSGLLKSARDHMDISVQEITAQFDHEKALADQAKEEADRVKAEADRVAKEAADKAAAAANVVIDFTEDAKMDDAGL